MGYDVHLTRAPHWLDSESNPISMEEWLAYIRADPEMRLDGFAETENLAGERLRYESPGLAVWTAWSHDSEGGNSAWFDYRQGSIIVKNPDETILIKMCAIAEKLGARVQGDDGEYYPDTSNPEPGQSVEEAPPPSGRSWLRRIFGR